MLKGLILSPVFLSLYLIPVYAQSDLPDGEGRDIVEDACTICHDLVNITSSKRSPEQWKFVVNQMMMQGAPLQDYEVDTVVDYLSANFGVEK